MLLHHETYIKLIGNKGGDTSEESYWRSDQSDVTLWHEIKGHPRIWNKWQDRSTTKAVVDIISQLARVTTVESGSNLAWGAAGALIICPLCRP
jgi:hypothetical protein